MLSRALEALAGRHSGGGAAAASTATKEEGEGVGKGMGEEEALVAALEPWEEAAPLLADGAWAELEEVLEALCEGDGEEV